MGAEKIYDKMPETLDFMQVLSIFIHSSFTDSGLNTVKAIINTDTVTAKTFLTFPAGDAGLFLC